MTVHRELMKGSSQTGTLVGTLAGLAALVGFGKVLKSKLPEKVLENNELDIVSKGNADFIVKKLAPMADKALAMVSRTIGGVEHKYVSSKLPFAIHDILDNAMNGFSICDYYEASDNGELFSLVVSNGHVSMECFWTGEDEGWKFFLDKQPISWEEALVAYREYVRNYISNLEKEGSNVA